MSEGFLVGIDLGSTATKVVVVDPARGVVAEASRPAALRSAHPGWAEADPAQWWDNVRALIPEVLASAALGAADVAGIATSGMVPAVLPLDRAGEPLRAAILQNDARAVAEIDALSAALEGVDLVGRTGSALTQQSVAPTLVWLRRHEPAVWAGTASIAGSYDWLARRLGARPHVEANWALESGLYTLDTAFMTEVMEAAGLSSTLLPEVARPGSPIGELDARAAAETGLRAGTPIVAGGADHVLSAYAAGLAEPGDWLVKLGGAGDILVVTKDPFVDRRLYLDEHPAPGLWLPNGCMATSGSLLRWFQELIGGSERVALADMDDEAAARRPASIVCLPYFLGEKSPLHDPDLRGAFVGLHLGHDRADLYRACLEAIAYSFRDHVEVFTERGITLGTARVTNGGSRSTLWKQILADVLGRPLTPVIDHPGAALGAALAAGVGTGRVPAWRDGAALARLGAPVIPGGDAGVRDDYEEGYSVFRELQTGLRDTAHRLAARGRRS